MTVEHAAHDMRLLRGGVDLFAAMVAAMDGVSTIMPTLNLPSERASSANSRASETVAIIGAITHGVTPVRSAAAAIPAS